MALETFELKASVLACLLLSGSLACSSALAQTRPPAPLSATPPATAPAAPVGTTTTLRNAVEKALGNNPEVTARLNAYKASIDAVAVVNGGWRPRVDLSANAGRDENRVSDRVPRNQSINRSGAELGLTQLLWDGLGTKNEVQRLGHDRLSRYFELLDTTEQTALEAARTHYDVLRYRRLVQLAEDNYVQHKYALLQTQSRFEAGVGRGVDLEQVNARLALSESNLATEQANLHDVTARYQRIVGEPAPKQLSGLESETQGLRQGVPARATDAVQTALQRNTAISAAVEGLRAARAAVTVREAAFQPRVEARLRAGAGHNFDSINNQNRSNTAEVVMNWNLYNGNIDQARVRQQVNLLNQATDLRDKACRDARQTTEIAFNDTRKLLEQLGYLERNELSIEKARDAYRQQFDIGQRSLLDLLNAENELYTARRANVNAHHDLGIAYARTHAAMNQLTNQVGLAKPLGDTSDAAGWSAGDDAPGRCPAEAVETVSADRSALDARAESMKVASPPPQAPASAPARAGVRNR
jgi:adhesin transport system outer membrane protein